MSPTNLTTHGIGMRYGAFHMHASGPLGIGAFVMLMTIATIIFLQTT